MGIIIVGRNDTQAGAEIKLEQLNFCMVHATLKMEKRDWSRMWQWDPKEIIRMGKGLLWVVGINTVL